MATPLGAAPPPGMLHRGGKRSAPPGAQRRTAGHPNGTTDSGGEGVGPRPAETESHAVLLLRRLVEEAQRALETGDPLERIRVLSEFVQPYAGWALREAVLDMRDQRGIGWSFLADEVGLAPGVVARQARGLGPMVTIAPSYDTEAEPQVRTPLRLAMRTLFERIGALERDELDRDEDNPVLDLLYTPVLAMNSAAVFGAVAPPPHAVEKVLQAADELDRVLAGDVDALGARERAVLEAVAELRTVYGREQGAVRRDRGRKPFPAWMFAAESGDAPGGDQAREDRARGDER